MALKHYRFIAVAFLFVIHAEREAFAQTDPSKEDADVSLAKAKPTVSPTPSPTASPTPEVQNSSTQPAPVNYFFPDAPAGANTFNGKYFSLRLTLAVLGDYTFVRQDTVSRGQVGPQASIGDLRAARIILSGLIKFKRPWIYMFSGDFNELRLSGERVLERMDLNLTIPLWKRARITVGQQKESFSYEVIADASNLPQQERMMSPFFVTRNVGIKYQDNFLHDRMLLHLGVYNDWFVSKIPLKDSGTQVSTRLTGLPIASKNGREYLHLGVAFRYNGADKNKMRFRGRPESNVIDPYVNTGDFPAKYSEQLGLEALYNKGPFSVLAEYAQAWVKSPEKGNPTFNGFYVIGSYVLTGENRPYDRSAGYARRITPKSRWGAVELVGRFSYVDLDDTLIKGGRLKKWYAGANWWASQQWKLGIGYGLADLDKSNTTGRTQMLISRIQWIY